jgi:hypothetical protein
VEAGSPLVAHQEPIRYRANNASVRSTTHRRRHSRSLVSFPSLRCGSLCRDGAEPLDSVDSRRPCPRAASRVACVVGPCREA